MNKAIAFTSIAACLAAFAGSAAASEASVDLVKTGFPAVIGESTPIVLNESQMDGISAGAASSVAGGSASAVYGTARSQSSASTYQSGPLSVTTASSLNFAIGVDPEATAHANSTF